MAFTFITNLIGGKQQRDIINEVTEFRVLKQEINKARCVLELDAKGGILAMNENLTRALSYADKEMVGQGHRALISRAEATSTDYQQFWQALEQGNTQSGAFKLVDKQGGIKWFQGYYAPVCDGPQKTLRKVVAYLTDITTEKTKLITAQQEESALNNALGVAELSVDGKFVHSNDEFLAALGYTKEEIIGRDQLSIVCPDQTSSCKTAIKRMLESVSPFTENVCRLSKTGERFWFKTTFVPVTNAEQQVFKVMMYSFDITTELKQKLDLEGRMEAISRAQAMIEFDVQGNILAFNQKFTEVMGYTAQELVGKHHSLLVSDKYKSSPEYNQLWDKLRSGEFESGYFPRVNKFGKEVWLQASYNPIIGIDGNVSRIVKFAIDITESVKKDAERKKQAVEAVMIKHTLESSTNNLMVADNDGIITYMNPATLELMKHSAETFRSKFPQFDPNNLIGQNFDQFHKTPSHQRNLLASLKEKHATELNLGKMFFRLTANPIFDEKGVRLGSVVEWVDLTEEKQVENQIRETVEAAVGGDVTRRLDTTGVKKSAAATMDAINQLLDGMNDILLQVREAGETINTAANEISSGNNDLSSRTEQQASNLEETASSMEQLSSTVRQNADNARQANQMSEAASLVAQRGGEVVGNVVSTMSAINESAKKIEEIITVIDGIAFQTNILALNAAVEAARAGEQGRGFAVVAGEVRNLAQRSAGAAKEIKELITDSVTKTAEGTKLVESAGATMQEIVTSVQRVTDIMSEITAASAEQSAGIDQVNDAITDMDEVTQQNAALVEEAAAAAESLVEQASNLMDAVSKYTLQGGQRAPAATSRPAAKPAAYASRPAAKPVTKAKPALTAHHNPTPQKVAKTGTDDGSWEEF